MPACAAITATSTPSRSMTRTRPSAPRAGMWKLRNGPRWQGASTMSGASVGGSLPGGAVRTGHRAFAGAGQQPGERAGGDHLPVTLRQACAVELEAGAAERLHRVAGAEDDAVRAEALAQVLQAVVDVEPGRLHVQVGKAVEQRVEGAVVAALHVHEDDRQAGVVLGQVVHLPPGRFAAPEEGEVD